MMGLETWGTVEHAVQVVKSQQGASMRHWFWRCSCGDQAERGYGGRDWAQHAAQKHVRSANREQE